jgi:MATE family multidrug resistance protein
MRLRDYTREFPANFKLGFPVMISLFGHTFVGFMDNVMVGKLGARELAASSLANSFLFIAIAAGVGISMSITPLIAEADGEGNRQKGRSIFHNGLFLCLLSGLAFYALLYACHPLLHLMKQPQAVVELAVPYFKWISISIIPLMLFQGYKQFADGLSETKYAMYAVVLANILNIVVSYLFIHGWGIIPKLGLMGTAVGAISARTLMLFFLHFILKYQTKFKPYFRKFTYKRLHKQMLKKLSNIGFPTALQMFFEIAIFNVAVWVSGVLGEEAQAANQIALNLGSMTFTFATGLSVTAMIRVGRQKGMRNFDELRRIAGSVFLFVVLLETFFMLLFVLGNKILPLLFLNFSEVDKIVESTTVLTIASKLLIVSGFFQIFDGVQVVALGALRGLQDVKIPTWITLLAYWVIAFPLLYFLGLFTSLGTVGIWIGLLSGLAFSAVFQTLRFYYLLRKL